MRTRNETPEQVAARMAKVKATWARKKSERTGIAETLKPAGEPAAPGIVELPRGPRPELPPSQSAASVPLLRLISTASGALAEVDAISVREIEESLPSTAECARVQLALEQLVLKAERMLSLVRHCRGLLEAQLAQPEQH